MNNFKNKDLNYLYDLKSKADDMYYNSHKPIMTDEDYDILVSIIKHKDKNYKNKIGHLPSSIHQRIKLPLYMGSLNKIKPEHSNLLTSWLNKHKHNQYILQPKLDGISCLLIIKNKQIKLFTRGNGIIGTDISHLAKHININKDYYKYNSPINIRGELIINKNIFDKKYSSTFSNARNFVSGIIMSKNPDKKYLKDIQLISYELINNNKFQLSPTQQFDIINDIGLYCIPFKLVSKLSNDIMLETLNFYKNNINYCIDGVVVQPNYKYIRNIKDNPKYAFAFKVQGNCYTTTVQDVLWNVSKWGKIIPRIKIEPVDIDGVVISYTTGFNAKYIVDNKIGKGSIVSITRSGDVIPYIVEVLSHSKKTILPSIKYKWNDTHIDFIIVDENHSKNIKQITSFFKHLNVKYLSEQTITKLYNNGYNTVFKILDASVDDFKTIEGFKDKLSNKIYNNIRNSIQNTSLIQSISAYGILGPGFSHKKINKLFETIPNLLELYLSLDTEELKLLIENVDGYSSKSSQKIISNLQNTINFSSLIKPYLSDHHKIINTIDKNKSSKTTNKSHPLYNKKIVFSGFRDKELQQKLTDIGSCIVNTISKSTDILVLKHINPDKITSKHKKAIDYNLNIFQKDDFITHFKL